MTFRGISASSSRRTGHPKPHSKFGVNNVAMHKSFLRRFMDSGMHVIGALLIVLVLLPAGFAISVSVRDTRQRHLLLGRSDYAKIAEACVGLAHTITNESADWRPSDPAVPAILRSLSPSDIGGYSNSITMDFRGGAELYIYDVSQSEENPKRWTLSMFSEHLGSKSLVTITND